MQTFLSCSYAMRVMVDVSLFQPGEHHTQVLLRSVILSWTGLYGNTSTVEEATRRFEDHVNGKASIPADLRQAVYRYVAYIIN